MVLGQQFLSLLDKYYKFWVNVEKNTKTMNEKIQYLYAIREKIN